MDDFYFDYNATTPVAPVVFEAMLPYFTKFFANPASLHQPGKASSKAVRKAREQASRFVNARHEREIVFTSGGTEGNNAVLRSAVQTSSRKKILTSQIEHSSVLRVCQRLEKEGIQVVYLPVDSSGQINKNEFVKNLDEQVAIVSLMSANNETGIILSIEELAPLIKERGALFHVDAVQSAGKTSLDVQKWNADFLTLSSHKFYGPKGAGILYIREGIPFHPLITGGSQESGRRSGTLDLSGVVGTGAACDYASQDLEKEAERVGRIRDDFEKRLLLSVEGIIINGLNAVRLPNTSSVSFENIEGEALLFALDREGIYVSSGSACMSGANEPSHVLKAMSFPDDQALGTLRFSFGRGTKSQDIETVIPKIQKAVKAVRNS